VPGADDVSFDKKNDELTAVIRAIQDRVRARHPEGAAGPSGVPLADLMPILHARDAAEAKVAAIGTVNPRAPGLINNLVQSVKRVVARALDWHVREQTEFNRAAMDCVQSTIEALNEVNRSLARLSVLCGEAADIRPSWEQWRQEWETKLSTNEIQFLRSVADLQTAYQHRSALMEGNFRDLIRTQHSEFTVALEKAALDIQKRLWADLERIRIEYEALIHNELRVARQRAALPASEPVPRPPLGPPPEAAVRAIDYLKFAERFRGSEDYVRRNQAFYRDKFQGCRSVLDLGCGRGEFLEVMKDAGVTSSGVELNGELVRLCRSKGLDVEEGDLFGYLARQADQSLDGIFCAHVVEHLPPARLPELVRLAAAKTARGGRLAIETPNPECLAVFSTHFYLDPTHTRPVPPALMVFYLEEFGFGRIEVHRLSPASESMPSLAALPEEFRAVFFGGLDYAVLARKLS
jgi:2-polyprenyl-3-methyl-5-hydroxy-6-metoxy-1,4-benzoquinol methylase